MRADKPRPLIWRGTSKQDFAAFPADAQRDMGYALFLAQMGERHSTRSKVLRGFGGATVVEIKESHGGNAYRAIYTVRYADCVYVLCLSEEVEKGHGDAEVRYESGRAAVARAGRRKRGKAMSRIPAAKDPARNVWLQLGLPGAEEHFLKAELVLRLDKAIKALRLTQRDAARRIGATQPELSKILNGKFSEVSFERLMRFLAALGHSIEIKIGTANANKTGEVVVRDARRRAA
jgi:phage-related protein/predicted XRE-type DNA-binding protein